MWSTSLSDTITPTFFTPLSALCFSYQLSMWRAALTDGSLIFHSTASTAIMFQYRIHSVHAVGWDQTAVDTVGTCVSKRLHHAQFAFQILQKLSQWWCAFVIPVRLKRHSSWSTHTVDVYNVGICVSRTAVCCHIGCLIYGVWFLFWDMLILHHQLMQNINIHTKHVYANTVCKTNKNV